MRASREQIVNDSRSVLVDDDEDEMASILKDSNKPSGAKSIQKTPGKSNSTKTLG